MKDCRTFIKLQEAVGYKQAEARRQGYDRNMNNAPWQANKQQTELRKGKVNQTRGTRMMEGTSRLKDISPR
jgi:hypothetical protein